MSIIWKPIPSQPRYLASSDGRIKHHKPTRKPRKPIVGGGGYYRVSLNGATFSTHRLVYEAFHGEIPPGLVIAHKDHDKLNNAADNLHAISQRQNILDSVKAGRLKDRLGCWVLTDYDVIEIREAHLAGETNRDIARRFGCTEQTLSSIVTNVSRLSPKHGRRQVPLEVRREILRLAALGGRNVDAARQFRITASTVGSIIKKGNDTPLRACTIADASVVEIRERRAAGEPAQALAKQFQVSPSRVHAMVLGRTYKHLDGPRTPARAPERLNLAQKEMIVDLLLTRERDRPKKTYETIASLAKCSLSTVQYWALRLARHLPELEKQLADQRKKAASLLT